jgi:hypothetical protein
MAPARVARSPPTRTATDPPAGPARRLYVTQWRWIQCERYARAHGVLGFWSMVHDLSCPTGFMSLWSKARTVFNNYLKPVRPHLGRRAL